MDESITIRHYDGPNRTSGALILHRAEYELVRDGLMIPIFQTGYEDQVITAETEDGVAVGVISYAHAKWAKHIDLKIGYVTPEFRGKGVYRRLWAALVEKAQELKVKEIMGNTHMENSTLRSAAKAFGRAEVGVVLRFEVPL